MSISRDVAPELTEGKSTDLFGHPRGLTFLFTTEMWERFSYYGMRSLLVLYMTKYLLLPDHAESVAGLGALRHALEAVFGPLGVQPFASNIFGLYTGLVYFTPILGGLLADKVLGQRYTVVIGAALMAVGHFMMAIEHLFIFALLVLILGNGCFKPNISTQVGGLYAPGGIAGKFSDAAYFLSPRVRLSRVQWIGSLLATLAIQRLLPGSPKRIT